MAHRVGQVCHPLIVLLLLAERPVQQLLAMPNFLARAWDPVVRRPGRVHRMHAVPSPLAC